jgi:hypothetical protein
MGSCTYPWLKQLWSANAFSKPKMGPNKDKQKTVDRSTDWSQCEWDEQRQQWYRSRVNGQGKREYQYSTNTSTDQYSSIPQSSEYGGSTTAEVDQSYYPSSSGLTTGSMYGPVATSPRRDLVPGPSYADTPIYASGQTPTYASGNPYGGVTPNYFGGSNNSAEYLSPSVVSSLPNLVPTIDQGYASCPSTASDYSSYYQRSYPAPGSTGWPSSSVDGITQELEDLTLNTQPSMTQYGL